MTNHGRITEVMLPLNRVRLLSGNRVWIPCFSFEGTLDTEAPLPPHYRFAYREDSNTVKLYLSFQKDYCDARSVFFDQRMKRCYIQIYHPRFHEWQEGDEVSGAAFVLSFCDEGRVVHYDPADGRILSIGPKCKIEEANVHGE